MRRYLIVAYLGLLGVGLFDTVVAQLMGPVALPRVYYLLMLVGTVLVPVVAARRYSLSARNSVTGAAIVLFIAETVFRGISGISVILSLPIRWPFLGVFGATPVQLIVPAMCDAPYQLSRGCDLMPTGLPAFLAGALLFIGVSYADAIYREKGQRRGAVRAASVLLGVLVGIGVVTVVSAYDVRVSAG